MKLLVITDYSAPYEGNFVQSLKRLEENLSEEIIYMFPQNIKKIEWIKYYSKKHNVYYFSNDSRSVIKELKRIIEKENIDIVYSHFCLFTTQRAIKIVRLFNNKIKLVQHFHNHYFNVKNPIYKWCYNGDLNIGCSKSVAESLPYKNIIYIDNAIDFERLEIFDENFHFEQKEKIQITMFGFDYERKGVDVVIKAMQDIAEKYNLHLNIIISVNKNDIERKVLDEFNTVFDWISLLDSRNDIATYLKNTDIFISASREEGFSYALVESAFCGSALISSAIEGVPYFIPNCKAFESENSIELSKAIIETVDIYQSIDKTTTIDYVVKYYNVNLWCKNIKEQLEKLIR